MNNRKPSGKTHRGLHAGSGLPDTGFVPHPAIATDEPPESYDPARAAGAGKARGFATGHGVRLAQAPASGSVLEKPKRQTIKHVRVGAQEAYDRALLAANERRLAAVLEYEGGRRLGSIAIEYGVTPRTVMYWVNNIRRKSMRLARVRSERPGADTAAPPEDEMRVPGLNLGTGGKMTDKAVRQATLRLEAAIVSLQGRSDMRTFEYRRAEA